MLAMWQAARNTDYYITKYGTKALEQLQNLIAQFAQGLRRLEVEEEQERESKDAAELKNPQAYKERARRVTLRLAMAANRATWASCCEMALFIRTGAHVRKTYYPRDIYLSRLAFLHYTCQRVLNWTPRVLAGGFGSDAARDHGLDCTELLGNRRQT